MQHYRLCACTIKCIVHVKFETAVPVEGDATQLYQQTSSCKMRLADRVADMLYSVVCADCCSCRAVPDFG